LLGALSARAQTPALPSEAELDALLEEGRRTRGVPGLAVAITDARGLRYARA
jgi:hypothetical protein